MRVHVDNYNKNEVIVYYTILLCIWYIRKKKETIVGEREMNVMFRFLLFTRERYKMIDLFLSTKTFLL